MQQLYASKTTCENVEPLVVRLIEAKENFCEIVTAENIWCDSLDDLTKEFQPRWSEMGTTPHYTYTAISGASLPTIGVPSFSYKG